MRTYFISMGLIMMVAVLLVMITGCQSCVTSSSSETAVTPLASTFPVEIVSVYDAHQPGQLIKPGGPEVKITLRNVSDKPVISLKAVLKESGNREFNIDFLVTSSHPLMPDEQISSEQVLIGGGWGDSIPYTLVISGNFENGDTFSVT